ncbi:MAG: hypothetical protein ACKVU1_16415 [bacterium]
MPFAIRFLAVVAQVGVLLAVMRRFQIENVAFVRIAMLASAGFVVHSLLPLRFRLPFFAALSIASLFLVLGAPTAATVVGLGLAIIGMARLPVSFRVRGILLLLVAAVLALARAGTLPIPISVAVWPILASMFMFRTIIYFYDLRHDKAPPSWTRAIAYFFCLPNVCFPLFPVIDYKAFRRTHYDADAITIYQTGVHWMARGVIQMLLYRLIYYNFTIDPFDVSSLPTLAQFLFTNFALYLRLSGQFHVVIGMLHLFGFNLPETNHLYWLSTSVSDFWRRINIYWKDFMMKVFYYPIVFSMRRMNPKVALVLATLAVFAITWALHLYQWFWLRGALLFSAPDIIFWSVLAIFVVANSLYEARGGARRGAAAHDGGVRSTLLAALRAAATLVMICVLWSLWTSASLSDWAALFAVVRPSDAPVIALGGMILVATLALAIAAERRWVRAPGAKPAAATSLPAFVRSTLPAAASILLLAALSHRPLAAKVGSPAAELIESLRIARMSTRDVALMERGYYEKLFGVNSMNSELWERYMNRPYWPRLGETAACRETRDFLGLELVPDTSIDWHGAPLHINRWGMRDRDYEKAKPEGAYRIACLGASYLLAGGVDENETFENIAEARLNDATRGGAASGGTAPIEILNFGVDGYSALERLAAFEDRVLPFAPDAVFCFPQTVEKQVAVHRVEVMIRDGVDLRYDALRDIAARAKVDARTGPKTARRRLAPYASEILRWSYAEFVRVCTAHGVRPIWIFLPRVTEKESADEIAELEAMAREAGFTVLSLADTFEGQDVRALHLAPWDFHPNRAGHELIGNRLYDEIAKSGILAAASR